MIEVIDRVDHPACRIMLDTFHMNIEEVDSAAAIRAGKGCIGHIHFVDSNRRPAGCGHLDYPPIVAALREIGYDHSDKGFDANTCDVQVAIVPFAVDVNVGTNYVNETWIDWTDWDARNGTCSKSWNTTKSSCASNGGTYTRITR